MRLVALYAVAKLKPAMAVTLRIPGHLLAAARLAFPDRLQIVAGPLPRAYCFSHLGLRHLLPGMLRGQHFICPFNRILQHERKRTRFKEYLNDALFESLEVTGRIRLPLKSTVRAYQGYHELSAFSELQVPVEDFIAQAQKDLGEVRERLQSRWPREDPARFGLLVFPGGTAHQGMPVSWARRHAPRATYAFFRNDSFQKEYQSAGLATRTFASVEELFVLLAAARQTWVTDSFPSHLAQVYTSAAVVMLTEQVPPRTVHPAFDGTVLRTAAPCAPCRHIVRGSRPCEAGHEYCVTWSDAGYTAALRKCLG
jgi:hypothetical protein